MSVSKCRRYGSIDESRGAAGACGLSGGAGEPLDGGIRGWCALLACWTTWFMWIGLLKGMGVMLPTLRVQFVSKTWIIGWVITIMSASIGFSGLLAGVVNKRFGAGRVVIVSSLMIGGGFMLSSRTTSVIQLALLLAFAIGPGLGLANIVSRQVLAQCFTRNYTTANSLARMGTPVATFVFAPVSQLFLDEYGWRGTMLLFGAVATHMLICGQLLCRVMPHAGYQVVRAAGTAEDGAPAGGALERLHRGMCEFLSAVIKDLDLTLFLRLPFWLTLVISVCSMLSFDMWYVYFISMAESKGFMPEQAAIFVTYGGISNLVLKVVHAPLVDRGIVGPHAMMTFGIVVSFASLFALPWVNSYWAMAVGAAVFLGCGGVVGNLLEVIVKEALGKDYIASYLGLLGIISGVIKLLLGFFPGWVFDETGSYDLAFLSIAGLHPVALLALGTLVYVQRTRERDDDGRSVSTTP